MLVGQRQVIGSVNIADKFVFTQRRAAFRSRRNITRRNLLPPSIQRRIPVHQEYRFLLGSHLVLVLELAVFHAKANMGVEHNKRRFRPGVSLSNGFGAGHW